MIAAAIGIDLGGTRIKGVLITPDGNIIHQVNQPTRDADSESQHGQDKVWMKSVAAIVKELNVKSAATCVGISAPGLPNEANTAISFMPGRLQGLENFQWGEYLGAPTWVLNDGVAALIAEAKLGAAKGMKNVAMLTLGTGVGGAILIDGKPYQGSFQKAGHIGHMVIDHDGDADVTGMPGSLEECIGNVTLKKRSAGRFTSTDGLLEARRRGDQEADAIWLTSVKQLAIGLASITNILSPQIIVLGGGITDAGDDLFQPLMKYMQQYEWRAGGNAVEIVKATFGEFAGATGAALFALGRKQEIK